MRTRLFTGLILLIANIMMVTAMPIHATESEDQKLYLKRLKYEFDNRTFAYLGMKKAAQVLKNKPAGVFYPIMILKWLIRKSINAAPTLSILTMKPIGLHALGGMPQALPAIL